MSFRIGLGFDSHAFAPGVPLVIGGLKIDHPEGLAGHSDGDLLLHAITDALLGAVSAGDIGTFFPPTDPKWKGADSTVFLATALEEISLVGFKIVNIDCVLIMHRPKIVPIAADLRERVADLLSLDINNVSIKGKTPEGLAGHSDGDLLLHAITDALLGAVSAGDIGTFFPPTDPKWKGADSTLFLATALEEIALVGFKIVNIDCVLIMHRPKIVPIAADMRERVADLLHRGAQEEARSRALPAWIAGREEGADVAGGDCAQQGIGDRVQQHVAIGVAGETLRMVDLKAADDERNASLEGV